MSLESSQDALLVAYSTPFPLDCGVWLRLRESIALRQGIDVWLLDSKLDEEARLDVLADYAHRAIQKRIRRLSIVTIGHWPALWRSWLQVAAWMEHTPMVFQSDDWTPGDWAHLIACSPLTLYRNEQYHPLEAGNDPTTIGSSLQPVLQWILLGNYHSAVRKELDHDSKFQLHEMACVVAELRCLGIESDFRIESASSPYPIDSLFQHHGRLESKLYMRWGFPNASQEGNESIQADLEFKTCSLEEAFPDAIWYEAVLGKYLDSFRNPKHTMPTPDLSNRSTEATSIEHSIPPQDESEDRSAIWSEDFNQLLSRVDEMLPKEYRGRTDDVRPSSMGSASIRRGPDGLVPWDEIWTSFCDLALAGGPPHRGKLLESVTREEVGLAPEEYRAVASEIRRGIELAAKLPTRESESVGWVGVVCADERMATWILRAILAENVIARREENVVYVPAGPHFRIEREIKNVITSVAKTAHYWNHHRKA